MGRSGPEFYDDDAIFATYVQTRRRPDNPNDTLDLPVILDLAGDLAGQRILDLGCGDAAFGRMALDQGAAGYVGVEGSRNMVAAARQTLAGTTGEVVPALIEEWTYPEAAFDLALSRLALHYVADLDRVLAHVCRALAPGGRLVFSVEHPVVTSSDAGWDGQHRRQSWLVDDYFRLGPRRPSWLGGRVLKHHRSVEAYFRAVQAAGFVVDSLRESHPRRDRFVDAAEYERRLRIPLFLFFAGHRP